MSENQQSNNEYWGMPENTYCMLMHLSLLAGCIIPVAGFVLPIIMWITNKDKNEAINSHGKNTLNWMISLFICGVICGILTIIFIGTIGLIILGIANVVFSVIAAIKANNNQQWVYPFSYKFIK